MARIPQTTTRARFPSGNFSISRSAIAAPGRALEGLGSTMINIAETKQAELEKAKEDKRRKDQAELEKAKEDKRRKDQAAWAAANIPRIENEIFEEEENAKKIARQGGAFDRDAIQASIKNKYNSAIKQATDLGYTEAVTTLQKGLIRNQTSSFRSTLQFEAGLNIKRNTDQYKDGVQALQEQARRGHDLNSVLARVNSIYDSADESLGLDNPFAQTRDEGISGTVEMHLRNQIDVGDPAAVLKDLRGGKFTQLTAEALDRTINAAEAEINRRERDAKSSLSKGRSKMAASIKAFESESYKGNVAIDMPFTKTEIMSMYPDSGAEIYQSMLDAQKVAQNIDFISTKPMEGRMRITELNEALKTESDPVKAVSLRHEANLLAKAYASVQDAWETDAASWVMKRSEKVADAWELYEETQEPAQLKEYLDTIISEQRTAGVPDNLILAMPRPQMEKISAQLHEANTSGSHLASALNTMHKQYGEHFPRLLKNMGDDIPKGVSAAIGMSNLNMQSLLLEGMLQDGGFDKLAELAGEKKSDIIAKTNEYLAPFESTMKDQPGAGKERFKIREAASVLTAKLMDERGLSLNDAAKAAYQSIIGDNYNFEGAYRIPKDINHHYVVSGADRIRANIDAFKDRIDFDSVVDQGGLDRKTFETNIIRAIKSGNADWRTMPDDSGMYLVTPSGKVIRSITGGPMIFSWDEFERARDAGLYQSMFGSGSFMPVPKHLDPVTQGRSRQGGK